MPYQCVSAIARGAAGGSTGAVSSDFALGNAYGFAVVCTRATVAPDAAAGGAIARVVTTELFSELKFQAARPDALEEQFFRVVSETVTGALGYAAERCSLAAPPALDGIRLIVPAVFDGRLQWVANGASALMMARRGTVTYLAGDDGAAPRDGFVASADPVVLWKGDTVLAAGRVWARPAARRVEAILARARSRSAGDLAERVLDALKRLDMPEQGDTPFTIIKVA